AHTPVATCTLYSPGNSASQILHSNSQTEDAPGFLVAEVVRLRSNARCSEVSRLQLRDDAQLLLFHPERNANSRGFAPAVCVNRLTRHVTSDKSAGSERGR